MTAPIVLASTSRYRRAILDTLGLAYEALAPNFIENHSLPLPPAALVAFMARGKAESLAEHRPGTLILGSDQAVELDGEVLGKPGTSERAVEQLLTLAGRTHRLLTAVALHDTRSGTTTERLVIHEMQMRPLTRALAEAYVGRDRPLDCAGSYKVEALGATLFEEMRGTDHTAIVGLPITAVAALLADAGVDLLERACYARRR